MLWFACLKGTVRAFHPGSLSLAFFYWGGKKNPSIFLTTFTAAERQTSPWDCSVVDFSPPTLKKPYSAQLLASYETVTLLLLEHR